MATPWEPWSRSWTTYLRTRSMGAWLGQDKLAWRCWMILDLDSGWCWMMLDDVGWWHSWKVRNPSAAHATAGSIPCFLAAGNWIYEGVVQFCDRYASWGHRTHRKLLLQSVSTWNNDEQWLEYLEPKRGYADKVQGRSLPWNMVSISCQLWKGRHPSLFFKDKIVGLNIPTGVRLCRHASGVQSPIKTLFLDDCRELYHPIYWGWSSSIAGNPWKSH